MASFLSINSGGPSPYFKRGTRQNENSLVTALERLSTGVRVNSASDDVAALSINNRLTAQLIGARTAIRNIADGASLLQTIESALGESTVALLRARELASRASNDYLSGNDVEALKAEFDELMSHVDSISEQTTFNGLKVLDGDHHEELSLQVGELVGDTVKLGPMKVNTDSLGRQARYTSVRRGAFIGDLEEGQVMINGVAIRATTESDDELSYSYASGSALAKVAAINQASPYTGVRAIAGPTIIEGFEPIQGLTLDEDHYFKINGHIISGFSYEDKDATGSLVSNINAAFDHTQVSAQLTEDGRINLIAEDGRNITIEYRGSAEAGLTHDDTVKLNAAKVRDSLRIIDSFGDPINLAGTVDPVQTILDGDIDTTSGAPITFSGSSNYTGGFTVIADALTNDGLSVDSLVINPSNNYSPGDQGGTNNPSADHVDYVIEVVKPGALGTATFRVKPEPISPGSADDDPSVTAENYTWAPGGDYDDNTGKFSEATESYYNEASDRRYELTVTKSGNPSSSDKPEFVYKIFNVDTNTYELFSNGTTTSDTMTASTGAKLLLEHGVVLDVDNTLKFFSTNSAGVSTQVFPGVSKLKESVSMPQPYTDNPTFVSWSGSRTTDYTVTVSQTGSFTYNSPPAGTSPSNPKAQVVIAAKDRETGAITTSSPITLNAGTTSSGQTVSFADLKVNFKPQVSAVNRTGLDTKTSTYDMANSMNGDSSKLTFSGLSTRYYTIRFDETGRLTSSGLNATVEVRNSPSGPLLDDYSTIIKSGNNMLFAGDATYDEGFVFSAGASSRQSYILNTVGDYTASMTNNTYTGNTDGTITVRIKSGTDGVVGVAEYEYRYNDTGPWIDGGVTQSSNNDLGNGVKINFTNATQTLDTGDSWKINLDADIIQKDSFITFKAEPRSLLKDNQWQLTTDPPEWLVGDTASTPFTIDLKHNYEDTLYTLPSSGELSLSAVGAGNFTIDGAGHTFKTGDEIRVHTRGFTGTAVSGGTYGDNLYPTYYKIVITEPGEIGQAKFTWAREDGRQELTQNPEIYGFNSNLVGPVGTYGSPGYTGEQTVSKTGNTLESGVTIQWFDSTTSPLKSYLSVGDTFIIPVGQKLEYTFGGTITLQSEDEIHLEYSDASVDNQLGRFLFQGEEIDNDTSGDELSLTEGILGVNEDRSLNDLSLDSRWAAAEAIDTLDLAVDQLSGMRSMIGALLNTLESNTRSAEERILNLAAASSRLVDADVAAETAELTRVQIVRTLNPQLAQTERLSAMKALDLVRLNSII